ncbi:hypothetical protein HELRODRAFT_170618 [Helobdella robusta]|uniref:Antistasin-like domain-containing protein n=1 Tax=Helobdella robusta TaxID=6412 RepID=T1F390_HELRO|nr:hypothetical protein HELRODRAFT_170618 [Helobdella robusta]ESO07289.1 hypothetical protein HELRODRAFT_170618 [Helobdella robusta]
MSKYLLLFLALLLLVQISSQISCRPLLCRLYCPEGYKTVNGCPTCQCRPLRSKRFIRPNFPFRPWGPRPAWPRPMPGPRPKSRPGPVWPPKLRPKPIGPPINSFPDSEISCPPVLCRVFCPGGYETVNDCPTCQCKPLRSKRFIRPIRPFRSRWSGPDWPGPMPGSVWSGPDWSGPMPGSVWSGPDWSGPMPGSVWSGPDWSRPKPPRS